MLFINLMKAKEVVCLVRCLPWRHEDASSIPGKCRPGWNVPAIPHLRQNRVHAWGSRTSQPSLVNKVQDRERSCLKNQDGWHLRSNNWTYLLDSTHMCTHVHICTHTPNMWAYTQIQTAQKNKKYPNLYGVLLFKTIDFFPLWNELFRIFSHWRN